MKNHFFFSYAGNKREEVEHIYNLLDLNNIDTIVDGRSKKNLFKICKKWRTKWLLIRS